MTQSEPGPDGFAQPPDLAILDVSLVFAQVAEMEAVPAGRFAKHDSFDRIRSALVAGRDYALNRAWRRSPASQINSVPTG